MCEAFDPGNRTMGPFLRLEAYDTLNPRSLVLIIMQSLHGQLAKRTGQRNLRLRYFLSKVNPWPEVEVLELKLRDSERSHIFPLLHVPRAVTLSRPLGNTSAEQSFLRLNWSYAIVGYFNRMYSLDAIFEVTAYSTCSVWVLIYGIPKKTILVVFF